MSNMRDDDETVRLFLPIFDYPEDVEDKVDVVAAKIMEFAGKECIVSEGVLDTLALALSMADVVASNASLVGGEEMMLRFMSRAWQAYKVASAIQPGSVN